MWWHPVQELFPFIVKKNQSNFSLKSDAKSSNVTTPTIISLNATLLIVPSSLSVVRVSEKSGCFML